MKYGVYGQQYQLAKCVVKMSYHLVFMTPKFTVSRWRVSHLLVYIYEIPRSTTRMVRTPGVTWMVLHLWPNHGPRLIHYYCDMTHYKSMPSII